MERERGKKHGRGRAIAAGIVALLLIVAALLALLYRDRLTAQGLSGFFSGSGNTQETDAEPFTYEAGSDQVFAVAGNSLAIASSAGLQLLDGKGLTVAREVFSLDMPAITAAEDRSVFFDLGGTALRVVDEQGEVYELDTKQAILSAKINDSGWIAVVTEETGYKAAVTVYNTALSPVYVWHSGSAHVLSAQVSPDCRSLAALYVDDTGSGVALFSLSDETQKGAFTSAGELFFDLLWLDRERMCLLSEQRMVLLDADAAQVGAYDFSGRYLLDYALCSDGFAALRLGQYRSGGNSELVTVDADGQELGSLDIRQRDVVSLSADGETLLVLYSDTLELLTQTLTPINAYESVLGVKQALLRQDGKCLLLSAYSAQLVDLR